MIMRIVLMFRMALFTFNFFYKKCQWNDKNVCRYNQQIGQSSNPSARSV